MLFQNPIGALGTLDSHQLRSIRQLSFEIVTLELDEHQYSSQELTDLVSMQPVTPIALRLPPSLHIGREVVSEEQYKLLFETLSKSFPQQELFVIIQIRSVALGEIFDYFETKPGDFKALQDYKDIWLENIIQSCHKLKQLAEESGLQLLLENAPVGGMHYFEPGKEKIFPLLRTPHHLLQICQETGIHLCFHTGYARVACNVLQYMKRSRSIFAAATEEEIMRVPTDWLAFYEQMAGYVKLIHLSDSLSWGDTLYSNDMSFRSEHVHELLKFADLIQNPQVPIILHIRSESTNQFTEELTRMRQTLKELKRG